MMSKIYYLFIFCTICIFCACGDDHDCHDCHIAYFPANSTEEVEVEIGEFCEEALIEVEANGYTLTEDQYIGNDTVPAGYYPTVHCEEHPH